MAVLYVALEGQSNFSRRVAAARLMYGDPGLRFARFKRLLRMGRSQGSDDDIARLIRAAKVHEKQAGVPLGLIIIDTLARALAGDNENEAAAISAVVSQAQRISDATGAAVLIVHHPGKEAGRGMRGSSSLKADVDVVIRVEMNGATRNVFLEKSKDGEDGQIGAFALKTVVLGEDDDGEIITSCVVEELVDVGEKRCGRPPLGSQAEKALNELEHLIIGGKYTEASGHQRIPDGTKLVDVAAWKNACRQKSLTSTQQEVAEARAFNRARAALEKGGSIASFGSEVWILSKWRGHSRAIS